MENKNFRIAFTLRSIKLDSTLNEATFVFRINVDGQTGSSELPFKDSIVVDANLQSSNPKIELGLETSKGHLVAFGELNIPEDVQKSQQYELNSRIKLNSIDKDSPPVTGEISILFINKNLAKEQAKLDLSLSSTSGKKNTAKSKVNVVASGQYSPLKRSSSPTKRGKKGSSPAKGGKSDNKKEKEQFEAYLHKLVEKHTNGVMGIVRDHQDVNDAVSLNKSAGTLVEPGLMNTSLKVIERESVQYRRPDSSGKISVVWDDVATPTIRRGNEEIELTAEKLKQRYLSKDELSKSSASIGSPSKRRALDFVADPEAESGKTWEKTQIDYLKRVILVLDAKGKEIDMVKQENQLLNENLKKNEEIQHDLRLSIEETAKELKLENDANLKQIQGLVDERQNFIEKLKDINSKFEDLAAAYKKLELQKAKLEGDLQDAHNESKRRSETQSHLNAIQTKLLESEKQRNEQINAALKRFDDAALHADESKHAIDQVLRDNERLNLELAESHLKLAQEKKATFEQAQEIAVLKQKLQYASGVQHLLETQKAQREELLDQIREAHNNANALNKLIDDLRAQLLSSNRQKESIEKAHADEIALLTKKINHSDERIHGLTAEANLHLKNISDLKAKISVMEQFLCTKEDVSRQLDQTKQRLAKALADRDQAIENTQKVTLSHQTLQDEYLEVSRTIKDLQFQLKERDDYIANLKRVIVEVKEGDPLYLPVKDDPIDSALAEYINNLADPGRVKILFVRESAGVYQFGSKKLYIKSEGDKILIRVGGGFINIEDFLEQNVPQELTKLSNKDPVKMLQKNMQLHKTIAGRLVNQFQKTTTTAYTYKTIPLGKNPGDPKTPTH